MDMVNLVFYKVLPPDHDFVKTKFCGGVFVCVSVFVCLVVFFNGDHLAKLEC